jgi:hypothetical protein
VLGEGDKKMLSWNKISTKKKIAVAVLLIGVVGFGVWQYQSRIKVAYYEVGTQNVEKIITVQAQTSPIESQWYAAKESGIVVNSKLDKDISVLKDDLLVSLQPFDFSKKQQEISSIIDNLNLQSKLALTLKDQASFNESFLNYTQSNQSLSQAWVAHNSALELFHTQMISSDAYKESLVQINNQLQNYMIKTSNLLILIESFSTENSTFDKLRKALRSNWQPVESITTLMKPKIENGKTVTETITSGNQVDYKAIKEGLLTRKTAEANMYVPIGTPMLEISNPDLVKLQMDVAVDQLTDLKIGTEIRIKNLAGVVKKGNLIEIDKVINDQMQSDGSVLKVVKVTASLEKSPDVKFYDSITTSIVAKHAENSIVVPKELVYENKGKYYVWTNINGLLTETVIEINFEVNDLYVIKSGIKTGDKLVKDTKLRLGQKIKF